MSKKRRSDLAPPFDDASSMMEGSFDDSEQQEISKSALKREMTRLQKLGEDLLTFKLSELAKLPITELLLEALTTAARDQTSRRQTPPITICWQTDASRKT